MGYTGGTTVVTGGQVEERAPLLFDEVRRALRFKAFVDPNENAGKPPAYLLIPHDQLLDQMTLRGLAARNRIPA